MDSQERAETPVQVASELNDRLGAALDRIESAIRYTRATISPGNLGDKKGEWVEIHVGRAGSSYRQLYAALEELDKIRASISA